MRTDRFEDSYDPTYAIARLEKDKTKMLWFVIATGKAADVTGWKVVDALIFPDQAADDLVFTFHVVSGQKVVACEENGRTVVNAVGIGQMVKGSGELKPKNIWVANRLISAFDPWGIDKDTKCSYFEI